MNLRKFDTLKKRLKDQIQNSKEKGEVEGSTFKRVDEK
jgi:hypothetical protein